jgi:hypothetical protein
MAEPGVSTHGVPPLRNGDVDAIMDFLGEVTKK